MNPLRISAVSYLNTFPFVYGILKSGFLNDIRLTLDVPSICAGNFKSGKAEIALIPAASLPDLKNPMIIPGYCLGAVQEVKTVLLLSQKPLREITRIHLDYDSKTSVQLVRVLAKHYWGIDPLYDNLNPGQVELLIKPESVVAIGDKTFGMRKWFPYAFDLATEWVDFTGLPFVFAVWVASSGVSEEILDKFNKALEFGIHHKAESLEFFKDKLPDFDDCLGYLENNISYQFDETKKQGLELFLNLLGKT
jgi:chorismate dehydratase